MQNILDKRQLGYKVTANSLYGQCGARTSTFYEKDVAACTTATGRTMIIYAKTMIEEIYGNLEYTTKSNETVKCLAEYIYGDSVASYTPILIRILGVRIDLLTIETLADKYGNNRWYQCELQGKRNKEMCDLVGVETWSENGWTPILRVIRHVLASHKKIIRIVTDGGCIVDVTDEHSLLTSDGIVIHTNDVAFGTKLLHSRFWFKNRKVVGEDDGKDKTYGSLLEYQEFISRKNEYTSDQNSHLCLQYYFLLEMHRNKKKKFSMYLNDYNGPDIVTSKTNLESYQGYVYDLTTQNHHFAAGVGDIIVHNTDSVFFTFNLQDPITNQNIRGQKALEITIEIAQDVAQLCSEFLKPPMELSYEKTLMPFILVSKKRYVGMLYETDANPQKGKLKYMGLSLKRRDSCDYLKDTYGGILQILMKEGSNASSIQEAVDYLKISVQQMIDGNIHMDKLSISKALRSQYKDPSKIAHWVLSERIGSRDPGNKPKPGDRLKFIHIIPPAEKTKFGGGKTKTLQGNRIETPQFILEKGLKIDYSFYITNQLMKPMIQLFGLALDELYKSKYGDQRLQLKSEVETLRNKCCDLEEYTKKKEKLYSKKAQEWIFQTFLVEIERRQSGIRSITSFYK